VWSLPAFDVEGLESYSAAVRGLRTDATSMEEVGERIVRSVYEDFTAGVDERAFALVRLYKTHQYGALPVDLQAFARSAAGITPAATVRCLTLLATAGDLPAWCERRRSVGHQAIPLTSSAAIDRLPMVARLVEALGLNVEEVLEVTPRDALQLHHRRYEVFFIPEATDSPWIPAQDFVREHRIRSVIGCGGVLPSGDLFALIGFAKVTVSDEVAEYFRSIALAYKAALVPFTYNVFPGSRPVLPADGPPSFAGSLA
jgi:hypothetical protein